MLDRTLQAVKQIAGSDLQEKFSRTSTFLPFPYAVSIAYMLQNGAMASTTPRDEYDMIPCVSGV